MSENEAWIVLGDYRDAWGQEIQVGLPMRDLRLHTFLSGTTGSGKSTFLRNLILQAFRLNATEVVIEPHGDLILDPKEGVLASLPHEALRHVIVVDLTAPWPPQINLVTAGLAAGPNAAVDTVMRCIKVVEEAGWTTAVRMREMMEHALLLLLSVYGKDACIVLLHRFLVDIPFRGQVIERASGDVAESQAYWKRMQDKLDSRSKGKGDDDSMDVPLRRVGKLLRDTRFRHSLSLPALGNELQIGPLLSSERPKLILVPLQATKLGAEAKRVFGTLFMQLVTNAFMARSSQEASERKQTLVLLDEFADLAGGEVGELVNLLLAQARKFGASLILATQSIFQLPQEVKTELRANTNIKIILRTQGRDDAKEAVLTLASDQLNEADILAIEKYHGYAKVMVHGTPQPPFYFQAAAPIRLNDGSIPGPGSRQPNAPSFSNEIKQLNQLAKEEPDRAIGRLVEMDEPTFQGIVREQVAAARYSAALLMANPELELDPVQRALKIGQKLYGLPEWMYEAAYRRLRFQDTKKSTGTK